LSTLINYCKRTQDFGFQNRPKARNKYSLGLGEREAGAVTPGKIPTTPIAPKARHINPRDTIHYIEYHIYLKILVVHLDNLFFDGGFLKNGYRSFVEKIIWVNC
jgi:hypothetical protein